MQRITDGLWVLRYPLSLLGAEIGRTVSVIRLRSGELIIHSTAPFTPADIEAICQHGRPAMLVEATLFHDTFSKEGRAAFPEISYAAPGGLARAGVSLEGLAQRWSDELSVLELSGMPKVREHVMLHHPTRTLIVADLVFNFGPSATQWTRRFFRWAGGIHEFPGVSRLFRSYIRDLAALTHSIDRLLTWDFDRVIVGHGDVIETGGKTQLRRALSKYGLCSSRT